jgi:hypothetical protein
MTHVPVARFEDTATEEGGRGLLRRLGAFVEACGIQATDREQIARTLRGILGVAAGHASSREDMRIAVIADVMPGDVQVVLRLRPGGLSPSEDGAEPVDDRAALVGGFELWVSFPRQPLLVA